MKRVAVIATTHHDHGRAVVRGVTRYMLGKLWSFRINLPSSHIVPMLVEWKPHGIIGDLSRNSVHEAVCRLGKPAVNIAYLQAHIQMPRVDVDNVAVGRMAAEHFLNQGFRHFAFFGFDSYGYSLEREMGYRDRLQEAGYSVHSYTKDRTIPGSSSWIIQSKIIKAWLNSLPKPVAIFARHDAKSYKLCLICQEAGIRVPEEVALLGVDNDEIACHSVSPALSSIALPLEQIGYEAAALLDRLMDGHKPPDKPILLPPLHVVARQSSDSLAIEVPEVREAVRYIREHAHEQIRVEDVLRRIPVNRRWLERVFRRILSRTPHEEINRVRIELAKQLLSTTDLSMPAVAERCGFDSATRLNANFRSLTLMTPSAYRLQFRFRGSGDTIKSDHVQV